MLNALIFVILPYAAFAVLIFVTPYRYFTHRLTWSAYSTEFLESRKLFWGSNPWHYGIILVLLAHLAGFLAPEFMKKLLGSEGRLIFSESLSLGLGFLALFGSVLLMLRRLSVPMLRGVTSIGDYVLLCLLAFQTATGVYIAMFLRWGSQWYLYSAVPYLYSLLALNPRVDYMADFPLIVKLHVAGAFLIMGVIPFTRLVHLFFQPASFVKDPPLLYRWHSNPWTGQRKAGAGRPDAR
jgi:nitrate reductase gamma subunit